MSGIILIVAVVAVLLILSGCASVVYSTKSLPPDYLKKSQTETPLKNFNPLDTDIGRVYADVFTHEADQSGAMLITSGVHALLHRVALVRMARHSIELQTYIYENDIIGRLLMHELKLAADRGVQVRILVDDNGLDSDSSDIMTLDYHPNINVKIFNPFKYRSRALRVPQLVFHVARMNYRMHNKLFIVDDIAAIVGGRNVASNYFDGNANVNFSDTDVFFIGKMAQDAVKSFDEYWCYHRSIPVSMFPERESPEELEALDRRIMLALQDKPEQTAQYAETMDVFITSFIGKKFDVYWGKGALIADHPQKAEGDNEVSPILKALEYLWIQSKKSIFISAAYFVPGRLGTEDILRAKKNGVEISILTNSYSSTDSKVVYAGWVKYRDELLANGVSIYEYKKEGGKKIKKGKATSSGASLHSKVIVFDDKITWVGSFNLDGRSAIYNTEVVAAFFNEAFAAKVHESIEEDMRPESAWRLEYADGSTLWVSDGDGGVGRKEKYSPDSSFWSRILMGIMTLVPESMI